MALPSSPHRDRLGLALQARGALTGGELAAALGVHRSQVSRAVAAAGRAVVQIGQTRRARYAARRDVRGAGDTWPVFRLDEDGRAHDVGQLEAFFGGFRWHWATPPGREAEGLTDRDGWTEAWPCFLADLRPRGFLGRALARALADTLRCPEDPSRWSADDTLIYLTTSGHDLPGNLVVGEPALRRAQAAAGDPDRAPIPVDARGLLYPALAVQALEGDVTGSSAGGEQPKFLTRTVTAEGEVQEVLVKFSPPLDTPGGQGWADLLLAEALAAEVLTAAGESAATATVLDAGGRRFLEVTRFDRVGERGRRGVISLEALHGAVGETAATRWTSATADLATQGWVTPEAVAAVQRREVFGQLIGNTDMHFGNLAFWWQADGPLTSAPSYDMLPMLWAPRAGGERVAPRFTPLPPVPAEAAAWRVAADWAVTFWERLQADPRLSPEFQEVAKAALAVVDGRRREL